MSSLANLLNLNRSTQAKVSTNSRTGVVASSLTVDEFPMWK